MSAQAPTLVMLIGPPAVGKMTIGQELARQTGMRLFFNHQIIDLLTEYLEFGTPEFEDVVQPFYEHFLQATAQAGVSLIVTWGWRFDVPEDSERVATFVRPFIERGGRVCAVELRAPFEVRLQRNQTENRRAHKKTDWATEEWLGHLERTYRYSSDGAFPFDFPHMELEVSETPPEEAASLIAARFGLPRGV